MASAATDWDLISSYAGLLSLACASIYAGSHGSLSVSDFHKCGLRKPGAAPTEEDEEEETERISSEDAYLFPVIGSVVLFGLYLIVKFYGKEWITWLLQWYFTFAGVGSVGKSLIALSRWIVGEARWKTFDINRLTIKKGSKELFSVSLRTPSLCLIPAGSIPSILYTFGDSATRRSALLTDVLGLSFSHNALSLLKLDSFKTGCILLSGLFLYDVWWVFGTEVMVKVATTLDVPIKLLWPKSYVFSTERGFTMLGLGDIVIPGMFVATALRYDYHRALSKGPGTPVTKTYFAAALAAYALGLITTMSVMHIFQKAQPALLYLSPACILSFLITSLVRGEFQDAWSWSDEDKSDKTAKPTEKGNATNGAAGQSQKALPPTPSKVPEEKSKSKSRSKPKKAHS
ncbi:signal peptide peptidase-domain-containing protein [Epithele typhae]|uniref:signal peptide peptidase-domain-containing protein n=1 Tax=Epithele typhae TaxID=378194 RepID=UPI002008127B|nr:signal peptide peptidase-domain-containing protein [Epithele typhae]KAH9931133.1 signal peptide peptidase-domain-containing protein [Epithele typhae]